MSNKENNETHYGYRGTRVRPVTKAELTEIYPVRTALDCR